MDSARNLFLRPLRYTTGKEGFSRCEERTEPNNLSRSSKSVMRDVSIRSSSSSSKTLFHEGMYYLYTRGSELVHLERQSNRTN